MIVQLMQATIEEIVNECNCLKANDHLTVHSFGINNDLMLFITKDENFNSDIDSDFCNLVVISTKFHGIFVDDTGDVHVTDGSLYRELERINQYVNFKTI